MLFTLDEDDERTPLEKVEKFQTGLLLHWGKRVGEGRKSVYQP